MTAIVRCFVFVAITTWLYMSSGQWCFAEQGETATTESHQLVTIPFTALRDDASYWPHQLITVNIRKDEASPLIPATFVFDTGANASIISASLAQKLNLPQYPIVHRNGASLTFVGQQMFGLKAAAVEIGALRIDGFRFQILPDQKLLMGVGQPIDGVLGTDLLSSCVVHLDFARNQITLALPNAGPLSYDTLSKSPVKLSSSEINQQGFEKALTLPLTAANGSFFVNASVSNGSSVATERLLLDTGIDSTCLSRQTAQKLRLKTVATRDSGGILGRFTVDQAWLTSLSCGDLKLDNLIVSSVPNPEIKIYVTLGLNVLANYDVLLDFPHLKMYLKPRTDFQVLTLRRYEAASPSQRWQWAQNPFLILYPVSTRDCGIAIPYDRTPDGLPLAQVRLDGVPPQEPFLLKSNINNLSISASLASRWNLKSQVPLDAVGKPELTDGYPVPLPIPLTATLHLHIGSMKVQGEIAVLPADKLMSWFSYQPVPGIIGANVVLVRPLLMDPVTHTWIVLTGLHTADLPSLEMADAAAVDILDPNQDSIPAMAVQEQQGAARFMDTMTLATGSPFTLLSAKAAQKLKLTPEPQKLNYGAGKDVTVFNQAHLSQISIGGVVLKDVPVAYPEGAMPDGFYPRLGMNVISRLRLLLDTPGKKLYVKRAEK